MQHQEYVRILPEADTAVMFIHGIVGTPNHFRDLIPLVELVPESWSVYNVLLDGHGGSVDEFAATSMKKWKTQVFGIFDKLCESHTRVILVAHSMGTLFATQMALSRPEKVPFLFMISMPMRPWVRLFGAVNCLRVAFGCIREDRPLEVATRNVCGVTTTPLVWKYIPWIPRFIELFVEIYRTEKTMGNITVPCVAWQSRKDELVSNFSAGVLRKSGVVEVYELQNSTHFYYSPENIEVVQRDFLRRLENTVGIY